MTNSRNNLLLSFFEYYIKINGWSSTQGHTDSPN